MFDSLYSANTIFDAMLLFHLKVSCLYHGYVAPGETFSRNTGAVHFTIYVEVASEDDTDYTQTGEAGWQFHILIPFRGAPIC